METYIRLALEGVLVILAGGLLWSLNKIRLNYGNLYNETLRGLVSEWNKVTQTINALVLPLTGGEKSVREPLSEQENGEEHPLRMSPAKRALYERGRRK